MLRAYKTTLPVHRASTRTASLVLITLLHVTVIYALLSALQFVPMPTLPSILTARTLPPPDKTDELPPPPPPSVARPPPVVPVAPEIDIFIDPPRTTDTITVPPPVITAMPPPVVIPTPPVAITPAEPIEGTQTGPEYPIISRRLAEQGTVRLRLTIGEDGMVKMAEVTQSSGFKRLDDVAKDWVLRHWRYRPAMRGPMPVESQTEGVLQFVLK